MILFSKAWINPFTYVNSQGNTVHVPGYYRKGVQRGPSDEVRAFLVRRYKDGESCPEIANSVGMSTSAVWKIVRDAGAMRPHGEAMALRMVKRPNLSEHRGVQLAFYSKKSDVWIPAGSRYEFIRMDQLENDHSVARFERSKDRIKYEFDGETHYYIPDLRVIYFDGSVSVEEIKPRDMTIGGVVHAKILAAMRFYADKGISYRVVTEEDIGWSNIRHFDWPGFSGMINADLTAERREKERARQRESRRKILAAMSPAQREERNRLQRERYKAKGWSDAELDERRRKNAESQRAFRARQKGSMKKSIVLFFEVQDSQFSLI